VNRFFRSALFPLVVIVLLVYLASQTLIPKSKDEQKLTYSQLWTQVQQGDVKTAEFNPSKQEISGELQGGQKFKVNYPSNESEVQLEAQTRAAAGGIRDDVVALALLAAEKVSRRTLSEADHRKLIEDALEEADLSAVAAAGSPPAS